MRNYSQRNIIARNNVAQTIAMRPRSRNNVAPCAIILRNNRKDRGCRRRTLAISVMERMIGQALSHAAFFKSMNRAARFWKISVDFRFAPY